MSIAIYDPRRLEEDEFLASFVARKEFTDFLIRRLVALPLSAPGEHLLLVGQRGMGKTSLLRRLAIAVSNTPSLESRFIPLSFREEQYNVISLAKFWSNCAESLAEWCEHNEKSGLSDGIDQRLASKNRNDSSVLLKEFLSEAKRAGGRPILFVDNLDLIINALPDHEQWELRSALQSQDGPVMLGAATQFIKQSGERDSAFFEFFHPLLLEPLSHVELLECLREIAKSRGESGKAVQDILFKEPDRLRTLHTLSGGNPRVLALIYQLLERAESSSVFSDLEIMLDQLTPFYKARVEEYTSELQRALIDAIALNWDPITTSELNLVTGIEVTTISPQLGRLRNGGVIEEVATSGSRSGYQLTERFFNIWYLMRHGTRRTRQRVRWLTVFLRSFYLPEELARLREDVDLQSSGKWHPFYKEALAAALEELPKVAAEIGTTEGATLRQVPKQASEPVSGSRFHAASDMARAALGRSEEEIAVYDDVVAQFGASSEPALRERVAIALFAKGITLGALGRSEEAIAIYDDVVARFGAASEPALREQVAMALFSKGFVLSTLGRSEEEIQAYDDVLARFGAANEPALRAQVAMALFNKGVTLGALGRREKAIAVYDDVTARFRAANEPALREQVAMALVGKGFTLGTLGRSEEEIHAYDDVLAQFGAANEPELREQVARALINKAVTLGTLGRSEEAITVYDDVVARFGSANEPALSEGVARALAGKGIVLHALGRSEEAITVCDDVVARFGMANEPALREQVARALFNKGIALSALGRSEEEIRIYDNVVAQFGASGEPTLREGVARVLVNKGITLGMLGRSEETIAVYDDVVARFGASSEPALRETVARALIGKGFRLGALGRSEEAIAIYDDVVARFGAASEPALREQVAMALFNKGYRLGALGRSEEEIQAYDNVVAQFGTANEPALREVVARALVNKGITLDTLGRSDEEIRVYDDVVARFGAASEPALCRQVAKALFNKGVTLGALGRSEEEIHVYDDVAARFGAANEPELREQVAMALVNKGFRVGALGRSEEEIHVYDDVVARFGASIESALREQVARALFGKGVTLGTLGRSEEAITVYDDVVARFGAASEPALRKRAVRAAVNQGFLLSGLHNLQGARAALQRAIGINPDDANSWDRIGEFALSELNLVNEAERAFRQALEAAPHEINPRMNLLWLLILDGRRMEADEFRKSISDDVGRVRLLLFDAGRAIHADNFGASTEYLGSALEEYLIKPDEVFIDDFARVLKLFGIRGYLERLVTWFEETNHSHRQAPLYAAVVAMIRGERSLLDFNPEVRSAAEKIYQRLRFVKLDYVPQSVSETRSSRSKNQKKRGQTK